MLSNLRLFRSPGKAADLATGVRPARNEEIEPAVRLILRPSPGNDGPVGEFVRLARTATEAAGGVWVVERQGRLQSAVLPVVSPGRTMLLFVPALGRHDLDQLTGLAIDAACAHAARNGVHLAQMLIDPTEKQAIAVMRGRRFAPLAELIYLEGEVRQRINPPILPLETHWRPYGPATHDLFGQTILSVYNQSLDCPALNGMRDINDVIAGHKATGDFDPNRWLLLCEEGEAGRPLGILLLTAMAGTNSLEVVYVGVVPEARGRGLGDVLMRQALAMTSEAGLGRLTLAVDAQNTPALKLYWRHGLATVCRRAAMLRDLRQTDAYPQV